MTNSLLDMPPDVEVIPAPPPVTPVASVPRWLWLTLGALVAWGFWSFLPKLALQSMQPHSVIFYEALGNLTISLPVLLYLRGKLVWSSKSVPVSACISVMTVGAFLLYFFALQNGPVATIVTLTAMYPVVVILLARIFLKEKLNRLQWLAVAMAIGAALLLAG